jgi:ABC-type transport system involved in multi-copper enzyme maturation permease subunit
MVMKSAVNIELYKLRTTPAAWVSLAVTLGLTLASVASNALVPNPGGPAFGTTDHVNHTLSISALTSMVMLAIGVLVAAGEYRHRTIMQTFLAQPRRGRVLAAKAVTVLGIGTIVGAVTFGIAYAEAVLVYGARGVHALPVDVPQLWVGATVATALYGLVGVAIGALTRNTVAAIVGAITWVMIIEVGILANLVPEVAHWLPAGAAIALTSVGSAAQGMPSPTIAALVLTGWALLISAVAARFSLTREVL